MTQPDLFSHAPRFDGESYDQSHDQDRLTGQLARVRDLMADGRWRTLQEIHEAIGDPHASISSRLRDLRKRKFGAHQIDRQRRGEPSRGWWEYRMVKP